MGGDSGVNDGHRDALPVTPRQRTSRDGRRCWRPKRMGDSEVSPEVPLAGRVIGVGHIGGDQNVVNFGPGNSGVGFEFVDDQLSFGRGH